MNWPFETSEPFFTPAHSSELLRVRRGLTPEEWTLPPTLVATFQKVAFHHLLERAGVDRPSATDPAVGAVAGKPVAVTRFPVGAPATAIALELAIARGMRNVLVVGSAGSLQPQLVLGGTVVVTGAEREDGTSHHYLPAAEVVLADPDLVAALEQHARTCGAAPVRGRSWTIDAIFRETVGAIRRHREAGIAVVEMEAATIFAVARVRGVRAGLIVAISDELFGQAWNPGFGQAPVLDALVRAADAAMDAAATLP